MIEGNGQTVKRERYEEARLREEVEREVQRRIKGKKVVSIFFCLHNLFYTI